MSDLDCIKADIEVTKADLIEAKRIGDRDLILMYGNQLIEQQKEKNLLLAAQCSATLPAPAPTGMTQVQFSEIIVKLDDLRVSARKQRRITKIVAKEVVISHRARMDKWTSSKRTKQEQAEFKNSLIAFYQRANPSDPNQIKCMVLDTFFPRHLVRASHIWKFETEGEGLTEFGLLPSDLSNPRNGFLLCEDIEKAFDVKRVCFLIDRLRSDELFIKVLDRNLLDPITSPAVCQETTLRFCDIDGMQLHCPPGSFPYRRILDFHAKCSFEKAIKKGWLAQSSSFTDFFDMSVGSSIPDYNIYQDLESDGDGDSEGVD